MKRVRMAEPTTNDRKRTTAENALFYLDLVQLGCPKKKSLSLALRKKGTANQKNALNGLWQNRDPKEDLAKGRYMLLRSKLTKKKGFNPNSDHIEQIYSDLHTERGLANRQDEIRFNREIDSALDKVFASVMDMMDKKIYEGKGKTHVLSTEIYNSS